LKYQPDGWLGETVSVNFPMLYNLRLDPFEKMGYSPNESLFAFEDYYTRNMWRFVHLQDEVGTLAQSAIDFPPMQAGASFNLDAVKKQVDLAKHTIAK
jgi:arylsulfatase